MRARDLRSLARFALAVGVACSLFALPAVAQTNFTGPGSVFHGVPASVTSFGFGGHPGFHGVPASVTSLGFGSGQFHLHNGFGRPVIVGHSGFRHHRRFAYPGYFGGGYYIPYAYPAYDVMDTGVDDSMEDDSGYGPTIFDRSGAKRVPVAQPPSQEDYRSELHSKAEATPAPQQPVAEQPTTVLVFKDGHQQEIVNYAIVGPTLYDLSDGRTRKVALAGLDLAATVKQNDQRGVDFKLPAGTKLN